MMFWIRYAQHERRYGFGCTSIIAATIAGKSFVTSPSGCRLLLLLLLLLKNDRNPETTVENSLQMKVIEVSIAIRFISKFISIK